nr:hypothetical protein [uncultured Fluviicola sp.]
MKLFLSLCYCLLVLPAVSQNKIPVKELKRYEWIAYNKNVDDSSEIFSSDTLFLAKSVDLESSEQLSGEDNQEIDRLYPRSWRLDLTMNDLDTSAQNNEFYFFFVDLRIAARRRVMEVDSVSYQLLMQNPTAETPQTRAVLLELANMKTGELIQITDSLTHHFYYIEKTTDKLQVLRTLKRRYVFEPKGLNSGFWTFLKGKQLITFSNNTGEMNFLFRVERIDKIRIRLIRMNPD